MKDSARSVLSWLCRRTVPLFGRRFVTEEKKPDLHKQKEVTPPPLEVWSEDQMTDWCGQTGEQGEELMSCHSSSWGYAVRMQEAGSGGQRCWRGGWHKARWPHSQRQRAADPTHEAGTGSPAGLDVLELSPSDQFRLPDGSPVTDLLSFMLCWLRTHWFTFLRSCHTVYDLHIFHVWNVSLPWYMRDIRNS